IAEEFALEISSQRNRYHGPSNGAVLFCRRMRVVERYRPENLPTFNCISAREQDGDGEPDGPLQGGRHGDPPVELPMAEERGEHCWSYRRELHDAVNDDVRQRFDFRCGGQEDGGDGDEGGGDAGGECGPSGTHNHESASESDSDGRAGSDVRSGCGRDSAARLPMAEERGEHCWSYRRELHDAVNDDVRQRFDLRCGREQHGGDGDERCGDADGCVHVRNLERECGQRYEKYGPDHLYHPPPIGLTGAIWHQCCFRIDNAARLGFSRLAFGAAFLVESRYPLSLSSDVP